MHDGDRNHDNSNYGNSNYGNSNDGNSNDGNSNDGNSNDGNSNGESRTATRQSNVFSFTTHQQKLIISNSNRKRNKTTYITNDNSPKDLSLRFKNSSN